MHIVLRDSCRSDISDGEVEADVLALHFGQNALKCTFLKVCDVDHHAKVTAVLDLCRRCAIDNENARDTYNRIK